MSTPQAGLRLGKEVLTKLLAAAGLQISVVFNIIIIIICVIIVSNIGICHSLQLYSNAKSQRKTLQLEWI